MSSNSKIQTQDKVEDMQNEIQFLQKFRCVERKEENQEKKKDYKVYNCDAYNKVNKDNIAQVLNDALTVAQQYNAVVRLFRVVHLDPMHTVSITITRGGLITVDIRFPPRIGGYQNVLTVRIEEIGALKILVDKLVELVQALGL